MDLDETRFQALWDRCRRPDGRPDARPVFEELRALYGSPGRHYHTPRHIEHCLRQLDAAADRMDDPDAVEMALWFHDAVYEPDAADSENERRSADLFERLVGPHVPEAFRRKVRDLILVTNHQREPSTRDERFMVDIDLSSFGLPWPEFSRDSAAVRREFPAVSDRDYYARQQRFLESLLERDSFCYTDFFRDRHETTARRNIERTLEAIRRGEH